MTSVLIIDDDVALREALAKHLRRAGHEVREAANGDDGIREFKLHPADVVVVDIFMPGQGGLQTISRLRAESPGVKIVAMSGVSRTGSLDVAAHAVALGADTFLGKPFDAGDLVMLIPSLLGRGPEPAA